MSAKTYNQDGCLARPLGWHAIDSIKRTENEIKGAPRDTGKAFETYPPRAAEKVPGGYHLTLVLCVSLSDLQLLLLPQEPSLHQRADGEKVLCPAKDLSPREVLTCTLVGCSVCHPGVHGHQQTNPMYSEEVVYLQIDQKVFLSVDR